MNNKNERFLALAIVMAIVFAYEMMLLCLATKTGNLLALLLALTNVICLCGLRKILIQKN